MSKLIDANKQIEKAVVDGYQKIEDSVVSGYKKIENSVLSGYQKVEDKFVETFLAEDGESIAEAKLRLTKTDKENNA